jgi:hypothetical protein
METFNSVNIDEFEPRGHSRGSIYLIAKQKVQIHNLQISTLGIDRPQGVNLDEFINSAQMLLSVYYRVGASFANNQYAIMRDRHEKSSIEKYLKIYKATTEIIKDKEAPVSRAVIEIENVELKPGEFLEIFTDADFTHWWFRNKPKRKHRTFEFFTSETLEAMENKEFFSSCLPLSTITYDYT